MQLSRSLLTAERAEELFHSHLKNQLITAVPDRLQGIHFTVLVASRKAFLGSPAMSAACSDWSPLPVSPLVSRPFPVCLSHFTASSSQVRGFNPPLELLPVFSPFPQSLLNHPLCLLLIIVPLSPIVAFPINLELKHCSGCSVESLGWGFWVWGCLSAEILIREKLDERKECPSSALRPGAAAQPAQGEPAGWERGIMPCVSVSV